MTAIRLGRFLASNSFIAWIGEEKYQKLANFCLKYIADLQLPKKRGTFVEFRNGMINVSPVGRNASVDERIEFEAYVPELTPALNYYGWLIKVTAMTNSITLERAS